MTIFLAYVAMISLTVVANLLLKSGAVLASTRSEGWWRLFNWRIVGGLCSFGLSALFYILILQRLPLNLAVSFAAAQYIAVIVASTLVLSEPIGRIRWAGIVLIATGIATVGWSQ